jgi:hypothetical protein
VAAIVVAIGMTAIVMNTVRVVHRADGRRVAIYRSTAMMETVRSTSEYRTNPGRRVDFEQRTLALGSELESQAAFIEIAIEIRIVTDAQRHQYFSSRSFTSSDAQATQTVHWSGEVAGQI